MSGPVYIPVLDGEIVEGGKPTFPSVVTIDMFGREYPLMHGSTAYVQAVDEYHGIILALCHPEMKAGMFLGVSPDFARNVATWLLSAADHIDGGRGKQ